MSAPETAWLIEGTLTVPGGPLYVTATQDGLSMGDLDEAIRFSRQVDAERVAAHMKNIEVRVTEHQWLDPDQPPSEVAP